MAVIAADKFDNFRTLGHPTRYPNGAHGRFRSRIDHPHSFHERQALLHQLAESNLSGTRSTKAGPLPNSFLNCRQHILRSMPQNHGSPRQDVVNIAVAIDIMQIGSAGFFDKKRVAAHSLKSPDRTVDPAWKELLSLCEILVGMFSLQVRPPYLENC